MQTTQTASSRGPIAQYILGRTGDKVSVVGIGGHHLGRAYVEESDSIRIFRTALDSGIDFLDNSWDYNDGRSEMRVGKALRDGYREKAFLMTKIDGRDKASAKKQLYESLRRLQADRIDLVQFHEVVRMNHPDRMFASGGAIEAALDAKKTGKPRTSASRSQESANSPSNVEDGRQIRLHLRHPADAA